MELVVITASAGTFPGLAEALRSMQMVAEEHPLIDFKAPADWLPLDLALDRLSTYETIALTSPRAALTVADRIAQRGKPPWARDALPTVWAGGSATAAALRGTLGSVRVPATLPVASAGAAADLATAMIEAGVAGPVLFPCGNNRREELPGRLRREGIVVDEVVCYDSVLATEPAAQAAVAGATVLVVASPSVAHLLTRVCPRESRPDLIAVGPTTAASATASGWTPAAVASHPTAEAVTAAVRTVLASRAPHE